MLRLSLSFPCLSGKSQTRFQNDAGCSDFSALPVKPEGEGKQFNCSIAILCLFLPLDSKDLKRGERKLWALC